MTHPFKRVIPTPEIPRSKDSKCFTKVPATRLYQPRSSYKLSSIINKMLSAARPFYPSTHGANSLTEDNPARGTVHQDSQFQSNHVGLKIGPHHCHGLTDSEPSNFGSGGTINGSTVLELFPKIKSNDDKVVKVESNPSSPNSYHTHGLSSSTASDTEDDSPVELLCLAAKGTPELLDQIASLRHPRICLDEENFVVDRFVIDNKNSSGRVYDRLYRREVPRLIPCAHLNASRQIYDVWEGSTRKRIMMDDLRDTNSMKRLRVSNEERNCWYRTPPSHHSSDDDDDGGSVASDGYDADVEPSS